MKTNPKDNAKKAVETYGQAVSQLRSQQQAGTVSADRWSAVLGDQKTRVGFAIDQRKTSRSMLVNE